MEYQEEDVRSAEERFGKKRDIMGRNYIEEEMGKDRTDGGCYLRLDPFTGEISTVS